MLSLPLSLSLSLSLALSLSLSLSHPSIHPYMYINIGKDVRTLSSRSLSSSNKSCA